MEYNSQPVGIGAKVTKEPIGGIHRVWIDETCAGIEIPHPIGKVCRHKGFATEAHSAVFMSLFEEIGGNRLAGLCDVRNPDGGQAILSGMSYAGPLRQSGWNHQSIYVPGLFAKLTLVS